MCFGEGCKGSNEPFGPGLFPAAGFRIYRVGYGGDGFINLVDVVTLIDVAFFGGPTPARCRNTLWRWCH